MLGSLRTPLLAGAASLTLVGLTLGPTPGRADADTPATSVAAAAAVAAAPTCGGLTPPKPGGGTYACSFEDDFDGVALDPTKWFVQNTALTGFPAGARSCYVDSPDTVSVSGGQVHLTSRRVQPFICQSPLGAFEADSEAATIGSTGRFAQAYGRFEFRARFPQVPQTGPGPYGTPAGVQGVHSALWLYPQDQTYGVWPNSGEIDVAERFSHDPTRIIPSVHYKGEVPLQSSGANCIVADADTAFHDYAVQWTPTEMTFFKDGVSCFTHVWTPDAPLTRPQPFDQPFYLVLSQMFGSSPYEPVAATPAVNTLDVDWVRVWK